ncbi:phospholipase A [Winogradskyella maritima]|nr:phospholipase A [Winogradskyella maritima]
MIKRNSSPPLCKMLLLSILIVVQLGFSQDNVDQDWIFKNSKTLSELWELDEEHHRGTFLITSYKPIYFTLAKFSTDTNKFPISEERNNVLPEPVDLNVVEAKFQLSMKTKVFYKVLWGKADVWAAYSQRAYWQIYNKELSRPFRETITNRKSS